MSNITTTIKFADPVGGHQRSQRLIGSQRQMAIDMYRQVSNIRRTKSQHLKDSRTVMRLSLPNPLKPDVKSRMKM